jgi:hypothetical protein
LRKPDTVVILLNTEQKISRTIINQLEKWKTLFEKNNSTGLTPAEQQGLFGELQKPSHHPKIFWGSGNLPVQEFLKVLWQGAVI